MLKKNHSQKGSQSFSMMNLLILNSDIQQRSSPCLSSVCSSVCLRPGSPRWGLVIFFSFFFHYWSDYVFAYFHVYSFVLLTELFFTMNPLLTQLTLLCPPPRWEISLRMRMMLVMMMLKCFTFNCQEIVNYISLLLHIKIGEKNPLNIYQHICSRNSQQWWWWKVYIVNTLVPPARIVNIELQI